MTRRGFCKAVGLGTAAVLLPRGLLGAAGEAAAAGRKPNIVFILADDIGYGDLGPYGATKVKTPNVDRLAREGIRFTDAHAPAAVCTPTRYAFVTGQYAWRNPAGSRILSGEAPLAIDPTLATTPSLLRQAGYATALVGKWHIGLGKGDIDYNKEVKPGPLELGFDYAFFFPATGDRVPCVYVENRRVVGLDPEDPIKTSYQSKVGNEPTGKENPERLKMKPSHGHDATIINGISRIGWMSGGKAARWNDETLADTFSGKAVAFIERSKDRPFFLYFATHDIHVPRVPSPQRQGKSGCGTRGDVIQQFDDAVGAVLEALDRLKLADNTLIIVSSDNGGVMDDGYADGAIEDANGHLCNGPLRGYKGSLWEGGTREPFIARWPGRIKAGATSDELISLVDMMATFAAVAGQALPPDAGPDSFNVLPALVSEKHEKPLRDHLVIQTNGTNSLAIRKGPWKLIPGNPGGGYSKAKAKGPAPGPQLFNLAADLAETRNVAADHPEVVKDLSDLLAQVREKGRSRP
ncbi:MAG: arylsulfatase [Planctomycetes bacterium]|nr:arylsulfatase [Planctomycetota bacterium]